MGDTGGALDRIQLGHAELNGIKFYAHRASHLVELAETQAVTGVYDEALATMEQAVQTNPDELFFRPEVFRLRGGRDATKNWRWQPSTFRARRAGLSRGDRTGAEDEREILGAAGDDEFRGAARSAGRS